MTMKRKRMGMCGGPRNAARGAVWLAAAATILLCAAACGHGKPKVLVPLKESAAAQYNYARQYKVQTHAELISDPERFGHARELVRATYAKVIEYFPEDRKFTPLARLEMIEMDAGLDIARAKATEAARRQAIKEFKTLIEGYPEDDFIQAKARYSCGMTELLLQQYAEAQKDFYDVKERFKDHPDKIIKNLAERANYYYGQVYTVP